MNIYWQLFTVFMRIGGLTFGGGLAQLPMLKYEIVQKKAWLTEEELIDVYAIGQCTPGIIAVNTATYVGFEKKGVLGGIVATLGVITPSIIVITIVAMCLQAVMGNIWVQHAMMGIRAIVCALMLNTAYTLSKKTLHGAFALVTAAFAFAAAMLTGIPTVVIVLAAAAAGIIYGVVFKGGEKS